MTRVAKWVALVAFVTLIAGFARGSALAADDTAAPTVSGLSMSPTSVEVSAGSAAVTLTATITDDTSGVAWAYVVLDSPTGTSVWDYFGQVSGDTYSATLWVPQNAPTGTWHVYGVYAKDNAGNMAFQSASDLGFTSTLTVTQSPSVLIAHLIEVVDGYGLATLGTSLQDKLVAVRQMVDANQLRPASNTLDSFVSQVRAQAGKGLTVPQASELTAIAGQIKQLIGD